jgi:hypothetical protein
MDGGMLLVRINVLAMDVSSRLVSYRITRERDDG